LSIAFADGSNCAAIAANRPATEAIPSEGREEGPQNSAIATIDLPIADIAALLAKKYESGP